MIDRRATLLGLGCLGAAGAAAALKPRRRTSLLRSKTLAAVVPTNFPGWAADTYEGVAKPKLEGLSATLYEEVVQRVYRDAVTGADVMVLIAYGANQSDLLQLHRPEVCYPALGFQIASKGTSRVTLPGGAALPLVSLVAMAGERQENILYWTRVGEDLPASDKQQREVLLRDAMEGFVPDGVLVRCSVVAADEKLAFDLLRRFIPSFMSAIAADHRAVLVGSAAAKAMRATGA